MKFYSKSKSTRYLLVIILAVFSACKSNNNPKPKDGTTKTTPTDTTKTTPTDTTKTPVTTASCKLTQEYSKGGDNIPLFYKFEYDANGNPSKISYYNNGALSIVENIQPDYMEFKEDGSTALYQGIKYDNQYLQKLPSTYSISDGYGANRYAGFFTYDSKSRLSTIKGGATDIGGLIDSLSTTITFFYNTDNNVTKITYTYRAKVVRTYTVSGFDTHPTPYHNINNSFFLQHDFILFSTDYDHIRYLIQLLSANNPLGYVLIENPTNISYTEDCKYTYDDKGQPIQRDVADSLTGTPSSGGFVDLWTYDCK